MSSESVRALGQPRLTKPTLGILVSGEATSLIPLLSPDADNPRSGTGKNASAFSRCNAERPEHLLGLLGHLLLHLVEDALRLLDVIAHHALHERVLQSHELRPHLGRQRLGL